MESLERATKHFLKSELACRCCGEYGMTAEAEASIEATRVEFGYCMIINSAYRCKKHNAKVGGRPDSAHTKGLAIDVSILGPNGIPDNYKRGQLIAAAIKCGVKGIGIYASFIHLDWMKRAGGPLVMWLG